MIWLAGSGIAETESIVIITAAAAAAKLSLIPPSLHADGNRYP